MHYLLKNVVWEDEDGNPPPGYNRFGLAFATPSDNEGEMANAALFKRDLDLTRNAYGTKNKLRNIHIQRVHQNGECYDAITWFMDTPLPALVPKL